MRPPGPTLDRHSAARVPMESGKACPWFAARGALAGPPTASTRWFALIEGGDDSAWARTIAAHHLAGIAFDGAASFFVLG